MKYDKVMTFWTDETQALELRILAAKRNQSRSELLRNILADYLKSLKENQKETETND